MNYNKFNTNTNLIIDTNNNDSDNPDNVRLNSNNSFNNLSGFNSNNGDNLLFAATSSNPASKSLNTCSSLRSGDGGNLGDYPIQILSSQGISCLSIRIEDFEVHIPGFMPLHVNYDLLSLGFTILRAIIPSFSVNEITNVRLLNLNGVQVMNNECESDTNKFPSLIIRLTTSELVKQIMIKKCNINYFNTCDLNISLLNCELSARMPHLKLFVNEALSSIEHKNFKSLKKVGKSLGNPEHNFSSLSDLNTIMITYKYETHLSSSCNIASISNKEIDSSKNKNSK